MFGVIGFLIGKDFYYTALALTGVYAFRWFHIGKQLVFHYAFAGLAFATLAIFSGVYWPIIAGVLLYAWNKYKKTGKHVFWFEMAAGIPYLFLI